jgi:hypothetical protein
MREIEYRVDHSQAGLDEEALDRLGDEGWILAAIHEIKDRQEVGYNEYIDVAVLAYHFYRPRA